MPTKKPLSGSYIPIIEGVPRRLFRGLNEADSENAPGLPNRNRLPNFNPGDLPGGRRITLPDDLPGRRPGGAAGMAPFLHLSSQILIAPGQQLAVPSAPLTAPPGCGLLIDLIKFEVAALLEDNPSNTNQAALAYHGGLLIAGQFKLGDAELTKGFIPLAMFSPALRSSAEQSSLDTQYTTAALSHYVWTPKEPIYVAPGQTLVPVFENRGFLSANFRVRVSYVARPVMGRFQGSRRLPYVMSWQSQVIDLNGTEVDVESTEKDLINNSGSMLSVEAIVGRLAEIYMLGGASYPTQIIEGVRDTGSDYFATAMYQSKASLTSSWGARPIREWPPWFAAYDPFTRAIIGEHEMPADGYYIAGLRSGAIAPGLGASQVFAQVSVIGSREVSP